MGFIGNTATMLSLVFKFEQQNILYLFWLEINKNCSLLEGRYVAALEIFEEMNVVVKSEVDQGNQI
jgi:hypothetical protein